MKTPASILLLFIFFSHSAKAQDTTSFSTIAKSLLGIIQETPSYKGQIEEFGYEKYMGIYNSVLATKAEKGSFQEFYNLSRLITPFRDNHIFFYQHPHTGIKSAEFLDSNFTKAYPATEAFRLYPRVKLNYDSLEKVLQKAPEDSVQGIYFQNGIKLAIYRTHRRDSLVGIILTSRYRTWGQGQVVMVLKEFKPNRFREYYSDLVTKTFALYKNEKYVNQQLSETGWKKFPGRKDYVNIDRNAPKFQYRKITDSLWYLRLGSFSTTTTGIQEINRFYDSVKPLLTSPRLIVDLRNNGGGGFRASGHFLRLLEKYSETGKLYVLINNRTFSNAEQFAVRMKSFPNVTLMGQTTNGTITYGNNVGTTKDLPGKRFRLYITDMTDNGKFLPYEEIGVEPDVVLDNKGDWIKIIGF